MGRALAQGQQQMHVGRGPLGPTLQQPFHLPSSCKDLLLTFHTGQGGVSSGDPAFIEVELALRSVQNSVMELAAVIVDRCVLRREGQQ